MPATSRAGPTQASSFQSRDSDASVGGFTLALVLLVALGACQGPRYAETEREREERERKEREAGPDYVRWSSLEGLIKLLAR